MGGRLAGVKRKREKKKREDRQISKAIILPNSTHPMGQPSDASTFSNTSFCNQMRNLEISNRF